MPDYSRYPGEDELDVLTETQEPVYCVYRDSGEPGAGTEWEGIYMWGNSYIVRLNYDEHAVVYPSLKAALEGSELTYVTEATQKIQCKEMTAEELAPMLKPVDSKETYVVRINDELWRVAESGATRET